MRIHFPAHYVRHGLIGGTENAAINLIDGISARAGCALHLHVGPGQVLAPELSGLIAARSALHLHETPQGAISARLPARYARFAQEARFARETTLPADVTIFGNYTCPARRNPALGHRISIIHDLQHRALPQYFRRDKRLWLEAVLRRTFAHADEVIFISQAVLAEARAHYGAQDRGNWRVVPNAVRWDDLEADETRPGDMPLLQGRYILSACHHWPHKNLATLLHAFAQIDDPDLKLVLTGQGQEVFAASVAGADGPLAGLIARLGIGSRVVLAGYVSRAKLGALYRGAALFVMPSLYEGFGLPPVEALGLGTPVLISDIAVLREVTRGHAGIVKNLRDPAAWARAIRDALACPPTAAALAAGRAAMRADYAPGRVAAMLLDGA